MTTEAQLGLIGGTMGLLTGFSILSGVEIVYYLLRFQSFSVFKITHISISGCNLFIPLHWSSFQVLHVSKGSKG